MIAWAPEDRPSDAQINAVLDEFEKTAWAGLEPDRYSWTAVPHREHGGGVHVHIPTVSAIIGCPARTRSVVRRSSPVRHGP